MAIVRLRASITRSPDGRVYYGWVVLAACTVLFFASGPGQSHTFSIFIQSLTVDLGIDQADVANLLELHWNELDKNYLDEWSKRLNLEESLANAIKRYQESGER